jgi:hypothetical protein
VLSKTEKKKYSEVTESKISAKGVIIRGNDHSQVKINSWFPQKS